MASLNFVVLLQKLKLFGSAKIILARKPTLKLSDDFSRILVDLEVVSKECTVFQLLTVFDSSSVRVNQLKSQTQIV